MKKLWYAVLKDDTDNDWGYGSESLKEAKKMTEELGSESYIAVIDVTDDDPLCVAEIRQDDFDKYDDEWKEPEHFQF